MSVVCDPALRLTITRTLVLTDEAREALHRVAESPEARAEYEACAREFAQIIAARIDARLRAAFAPRAFCMDLGGYDIRWER